MPAWGRPGACSWAGHPGWRLWDQEPRREPSAGPGGLWTRRPGGAGSSKGWGLRPQPPGRGGRGSRGHGGGTTGQGGAGTELVFAAAACCLHLRGEAPRAVTRAILSLSPFMAPEVSGGGWRTVLALRWKWKHREQKDSSHHPLPGTGILNTQLRGRPAEPAGREPLILAEGPATLGVPAARPGPAWASREAVAAACSLAGAQWGGEEGAAAQLQPPRRAAEPSRGRATGGHWGRGSPLIPDPLKSPQATPSASPAPASPRSPSGCPCLAGPLWAAGTLGVWGTSGRTETLQGRKQGSVYSMCPEQAQDLAVSEQEIRRNPSTHTLTHTHALSNSHTHNTLINWHTQEDAVLRGSKGGT